MHLIYIRHIGAYEGDETLFASLYKQPYTWAGLRDLIDTDTKCIVVYHGSIDITDDSKLRVSAAVTVPPGTRVLPPVGEMVLEPGKYACARFCLDADQYYRAWQWVFADWLPQSDFQPGDSPCFEYYPDIGEKKKDSGTMTVDICLPVVPL